MSDQHTPETERIKCALHTNWNDLMNHARKLERERDEAREIAKEAINGLHNLGDYDLPNRLASNLEETK